MHVSTDMYMYIYIYIYIYETCSLPLSIYMYTYMYRCTHICICIYIYICVYDIRHIYVFPITSRSHKPYVGTVPDMPKTHNILTNTGHRFGH